jgi:hypothetical protein
LFEGWAASLWSADTSDAAVVLARELVRRGRISAPLLADEAFRQDLLMAALMIRGRIREAAQMLELITPGAAAELAMVGALPREWAERTFGGWLDRADGNAVYGLEWWGAEHDTVALRAFEHLCAGPTKAEAPCFGDFGAQAARAYVALARRDSAGALERFLALPDTLCECVLHRFTTVRLLHHFGRDTEADARLRLPIAGLRRGVALSALLWKLERGRNAERMGDSATARREYSHVLELWRRADPELAQFRREAEDGLRRVQR